MRQYIITKPAGHKVEFHGDPAASAAAAAGPGGGWWKDPRVFVNSATRRAGRFVAATGTFVETPALTAATGTGVGRGVFAFGHIAFQPVFEVGINGVGHGVKLRAGLRRNARRRF